MKTRLVRRGQRYRRWARPLMDGAVWFAAVFVAYWLRYDFEAVVILVGGTVVVALVASLVHVAIGSLIGPYRVGHQLGSFDEAVDLSRVVVLTTIGLTLWASIDHTIVIPRTVPLIAGVFGLSGMFAWRFLVRSLRNRRAVARTQERRVIVFGAGEAGRRLLRSMMRDPESGFTPVALLDDDRSKRRMHIDGVRVRGGREDITRIADEYGATALVVALPQANAALVRELTDRAAGLDVLVLPPLTDLIGKGVTSRDLHSVNVEDLLGRRPISLDATMLSDQITGKRILVTGAGGSIGSELCRQIARFSPAKLYLLDRDESGLLETQMSLTGHGLLQGDEVVLGDIRDADAMRTIFAETRPDVVFHAAALKHLPLLESFPLEAWKTNVLGTLNVLSAAAEVGVSAFVNVSTDKAADATCVLGYSKRIAERLTADYATSQPGRYVSVRFGNVLGSRGSVVHTFTAQIERGGPITITHPDVERFFMLIPEACQLVLEAGATGFDGEVMVLDMGEPVKIIDLAKSLIRISGRRDIEINYTGLRPGEKLSEDLFSENEGRRPSANPLINTVKVPTLAHDDVRRLDPASHEVSKAIMLRLCALPSTTPVSEQ
jgi:FlaA1/EpsC-like NDP-sugar epimerase